ncbi:MAG: DUF4347 domain-containing protein [Moorea sp. SIO2I5]|nr:DUF4347 domain-containing protein [Moorena sp. SIO2I5]
MIAEDNLSKTPPSSWDYLKLMSVNAPVSVAKCNLDNTITAKSLTWVKRSLGSKILVVIAPDVESPEFLANGVIDGANSVILRSDTDGVRQITVALATGCYRSLHVISHGSPGRVYLAQTVLCVETLEQYRRELLEWGVDEVALYGCRVGAGNSAKAFLVEIGKLLKAHVSGSSRLTGNSLRQHNWILDFSTGKSWNSIRSGLRPEVMEQYRGLLSNSIELFPIHEIESNLYKINFLPTDRVFALEQRLVSTSKSSLFLVGNSQAS